MLHDLRFALRTLGRNPGFASTAAATFAIGICAVAVTFSLVNALLLRPLQVADADRLVIVANKDRHTTLPHPISCADYKDYARATRSKGRLPTGPRRSIWPRPASISAYGRNRSQATTFHFFAPVR